MPVTRNQPNRFYVTHTAGSAKHLRTLNTLVKWGRGADGVTLSRSPERRINVPCSPGLSVPVRPRGPSAGKPGPAALRAGLRRELASSPGNRSDSWKADDVQPVRGCCSGGFQPGRPPAAAPGPPLGSPQQGGPHAGVGQVRLSRCPVTPPAFPALL